ncbi:stage V sporulation protein AB [Thermoactinomyces mirandus]|uniref:Stage V sporulation protein AB n=1 Tax=Thermoactinomyces mirandus TaxID=2756294 RepID=A0A7W1XPM7_9BACL|nr:stage V sporulation protein AB [Thermoactinomyces mirandus]MBA4600963.1 stage V sporulation protein AB [Thermoactinomyces mirandus]
MNLVHDLLLVLIGLAGGVAVGSGFVAFITVLDIVPRLAQVTCTQSRVYLYEYVIGLGVLFFTWIDFRTLLLSLPHVFTAIFGLNMGIYVGMLAAALTEVVNVIPITARRLNMQEYMIYFLIAMALGKVTGSLVEWFLFQNF